MSCDERKWVFGMATAFGLDVLGKMRHGWKSVNGIMSHSLDNCQGKRDLDEA